MNHKGITLFLVNLIATVSVYAQQPNIVWIVSEDNSKHYMKLFDPNGIETPAIENLAKDGIVFDRAFSNAAVCSAARSTLITSSYGPRMVSHYHRCEGKVSLTTNQEMFPAYLKKAGYYTANNAKEDYNFNKSNEVWDESSKKASWKNRKEGQPFFFVFNIETTHESRIHFSKETMNTTKTSTDPNTVFVQPNHPQTSLFKYTNTYYRDKIKAMDKEVGTVIDKLKKDGQYENTIIFYYGDHGGVLPDSKGYLTETGLHVPLVVYVPEKYQNQTVFKAGTRNNTFVSFVDFGATVLNLAGVDVPESMDGKPFLGKNISAKNLEKRDQTFGYADRFDEKYDMVRSLRKGNMKYVRNFEPFNVDGLLNEYRYKQLAYQEWYELYKAGKLDPVQSQFFEPKTPEALYDVINDPFETKNLVNDPNYKSELLTLRKELSKWMQQQPDLSFYPEFFLLENAIQDPVAFGNKHKKEIKKYNKIADLALLDFNKAACKIEKYLKSNDQWERYWAIIVATSFGEKAKPLTDKIQALLQTDNLNINRFRAAQFLAIVAQQNTSKQISETLYQSKKDTEALLILNGVVLLQDFYQKFNFNIEYEKINEKVRESNVVGRRLEYLKIFK